jgi:hypothetical protein
MELTGFMNPAAAEQEIRGSDILVIESKHVDVTIIYPVNDNRSVFIVESIVLER